MWLKSVLFLCLIANYIVAYQKYVGDSCIVKKDGSDGVCKLANECEDAVKDIQARKFRTHLRCGFVDSEEVVCCADVATKFGDDNAIKIANSECEKIDVYPQLKILLGTEALPGEFPHTVALGYPENPGSEESREYKFGCGGTIIAPRYILTAGHCVLQPIPPAIVRVGIVDLGPQTFQPDTDYIVEEAITYPNYNRSRNYNDIALLRLQKSLPFNAYINAACLETNYDIAKGQNLEVSGWGQISNTRPETSPFLLKTSIKTVLSTDCAPHYKGNWKMPQGIVAGQFCAGDEEGHDTCQGDSGGPATIPTDDGKFKLVGVTSFSRGCGSTIPAIYTRVAHYIDWIVANVWPTQLRNSV